jgi:hypothetical protein
VISYACISIKHSKISSKQKVALYDMTWYIPHHMAPKPEVVTRKIEYRGVVMPLRDGVPFNPDLFDNQILLMHRLAHFTQGIGIHSQFIIQHNTMYIIPTEYATQRVDTSEFDKVFPNTIKAFGDAVGEMEIVLIDDKIHRIIDPMVGSRFYLDGRFRQLVEKKSATQYFEILQ